MSTLDKLSSKTSQNAFDKKVLSTIQHLHPYVKHRIYIGESKGILPKNMFKANGIIDEAIAILYQNGFNIDEETMGIKLKLFKIVDNELELLFKKEAFHQNTMSTDHILKEELDRLKEDFTMDANLDVILNTELDDISYHQDEGDHVYVYSDKDSNILKTFEIEDLSHKDARVAFRKIYRWLPMNVSDIVDLYAFGKLEIEEIAEIRNLEISRIKNILEAVRKRFHDHLPS